MKRILFIFILLMGSTSMMLGQCFPDKHNTTWYDGWISCEASLNPNPEHGLSHWIMYDFGKKIEMKAMHIWNSNIPGFLDYDMRSVAIDYSDDGLDWQELGIYEFEQATGKNIYEGFDLESFNSFRTRYLLLTAISNYGGDCYGLSEIRFDYDSTAYGINETDESCFAATIYPNPFINQTVMSISNECNKKTLWFVTDSYGRVLIQETEIPSYFSKKIIVDGSGWSAGIYYLTIKQDDKIQQYKLVKLKRK